MNQEMFDAFIHSSHVRALKLAAPNQWFVSSGGGTGAFGITVRRSQRFYQLSDGLYYSWWQLTLQPPACFTADQAVLLADDPQVEALVARLVRGEVLVAQSAMQFKTTAV